MLVGWLVWLVCLVGWWWLVWLVGLVGWLVGLVGLVGLVWCGLVLFGFVWFCLFDCLFVCLVGLFGWLVAVVVVVLVMCCHLYCLFPPKVDSCLDVQSLQNIFTYLQGGMSCVSNDAFHGEPFMAFPAHHVRSMGEYNNVTNLHNSRNHRILGSIPIQLPLAVASHDKSIKFIHWRYQPSKYLSDTANPG